MALLKGTNASGGSYKSKPSFTQGLSRGSGNPTGRRPSGTTQYRTMPKQAIVRRSAALTSTRGNSGPVNDSPYRPAVQPGRTVQGLSRGSGSPTVGMRPETRPAKRGKRGTSNSQRGKGSKGYITGVEKSRKVVSQAQKEAIGRRKRKSGPVAKNYKIQSGDTLSDLARRFGTTVDDLARRNGITDPNRIYAGANLKYGSNEPKLSADVRRQMKGYKKRRRKANPSGRESGF